MCLVTSLGDCACLLEGKGWVFLGGVGYGGSLRRGGGSGGERRERDDGGPSKNISGASDIKYLVTLVTGLRNN